MQRPSLGVVVLILIAVAGGVRWYLTEQRGQVAAMSAPERAALHQHNHEKGHPTVHLYTATWCGYCKKLKAGLDGSGVPYIDHDVEDSSEGRQFFQSSNFSGVPVTVIGESAIEGYDAQELTQLFDQAGYKVAGL